MMMVSSIVLAAALVAPSPIPAAWTGRGFECVAPSQAQLPRFCNFVEKTLAPAGINTIFLQIDKSYQYACHPGCGVTNGLTAADIRVLREACSRAGVKIMPYVRSLGHLSDNRGVVTYGLLKGYPEFDEAKGAKIDYCYRNLCPKHPGVYKVMTEMLDEIVQAFGTDIIHIGCDEVLGLGKCERCRDIPKSKLFADWVNSLARHLKARGVTTMIWGDRLIDHKTSPYDVWESSECGTADALELLDRDIVICDWHYYETPPFPSVRRFTEAGFRTWICVTRFEKAARMFIEAAKRDGGDKVAGIMYTNWMPCERMMNAYEDKRFTDFDDPLGRGPDKPRLAVRTFHKLFPKASHKWDLYDGTELPTEGRSVAKGKGGATWYDRLKDGTAADIPPAVRKLQSDTAGVCFRFRTTSDRLLVDWTPLDAKLEAWHMPSTGQSGVDVYQLDPKRGWRRVLPPWPNPPKANGARYVWNLWPNRPTYVYLPLYNGLKSITLGVKPGCPIEPVPHASGITKPVVVYGTSVTQGGCVSHPGLCPTSVAGRSADVPVINLGFSGSGKMEPGLFKRVSEIDASCYVLHTVANMDMKLLKERFEKFTCDLMAKHPDVPVIVATDRYMLDATCKRRNDFVAAMVKRLKSEDPAKFAKLSLACEDDPELVDVENTVEGLHLNDIGALRWGENLARAIRSALDRRNDEIPVNGL